MINKWAANNSHKFFFWYEVILQNEVTLFDGTDWYLKGISIRDKGFKIQKKRNKVRVPEPGNINDPTEKVYSLPWKGGAGRQWRHIDGGTVARGAASAIRHANHRRQIGIRHASHRELIGIRRGGCGCSRRSGGGHLYSPRYGRTNWWRPSLHRLGNPKPQNLVLLRWENNFFLPS